jgi:hypothetical protein
MSDYLSCGIINTNLFSLAISSSLKQAQLFLEFESGNYILRGTGK